MKPFLATLLTFLAAAAFATAAEKPNIILVMVDDLGANRFGVYGSTEYETPHIDQMASEGLMFENAFSMPVCGPTRATIMSGRYAFRSGVGQNQRQD